jgi:hypothetical protein
MRRCGMYLLAQASRAPSGREEATGGRGGATARTTMRPCRRRRLRDRRERASRRLSRPARCRDRRGRDRPVDRAEERRGSRRDADFVACDALRLDRLGRVFDTVLDCGLFHAFDSDERRAYVASMASVTRRGGRLARPQIHGPVLEVNLKRPQQPHLHRRATARTRLPDDAAAAVARGVRRVRTRHARHDGHGPVGRRLPRAGELHPAELRLRRAREHLTALRSNARPACCSRARGAAGGRNGRRGQKLTAASSTSPPPCR